VERQRMIKVLVGAAVGVALVLGSVSIQANELAEGENLNADITLKTTNTALLNTEVSAKSMSQLIMDIENLPDKTVYLFIQSPGGSVDAGLGFIQYLSSTDKHVVCVADYAASMAFAILQACHTRVGMSNSVLMQHNVSFGLRHGPLPNQLSLIELIRAEELVLDSGQSRRIGISLSDFRKKVRDDYWIYGNSNLEQGIVDSMQTVACSSELRAVEIDKKVQSFLGTVDVTFSGCPLISYPVKISNGKFRLSRQYTTKAIKLINRR